ncbi:cytochrome b561 domain-containing protein At4g18260-like [Momordica charantia]|uniref:Cytochrome b561 domain-containing protein At4g18260-like n=1 Tax=Momordica charantia TaxID=3673 RepID=A0A6J1C479_MOMCH|nr:cytochrome b561 domain-containing protein At4g18260-like [Momordica charantia]XP_022136691.1 cytochrome b561 domain-containing protein At4g18260-like [Momordica charantia]
MSFLQKRAFSFSIPKSSILLLFLLLTFQPVSSSKEPMKNVGFNTTKKDHSQKMSSSLLFDITLHGFLLWASMGFLMPVGILVIRMSNREQCGRRLKILLYIHTILQILSVLLVTAGGVMSIKKFNNAFNNNHQRIGIGLYGMIWLQALIGIVRPKRGSNRRSLWFFIHWVLGTAVSLLGIFNVYSGLFAYHEKTSRSIGIWTTIFTVEISLISFFYLFQDKLEYIKKQGVILGNDLVTPTDQVLSPNDKQKELPTDPC